MYERDHFNSLSPEEQQAYLDSATLAPPPGVTSNFDNPSNHNPLALAVTIACIIPTITVVVIRTYTKVCVERKVRLEDCEAPA
jgi:hypothetical protein